MITWVTVWFMLVDTNHGSQYSNMYQIPYATQEICLKQARKLEKKKIHSKAECVFGQMPVYKEIKK